MVRPIKQFCLWKHLLQFYIMQPFEVSPFRQSSLDIFPSFWTQAPPKKGADKGVAKGKRARRRKLKAESESGGSSEEESDFEAPAGSRPCAPSGRITRSQPASMPAETHPAQDSTAEPLTV